MQLIKNHCMSYIDNMKINIHSKVYFHIKPNGRY